MTVELSVLIVNWNGGDLLTKCIESVIFSKPNVSYEIIVIDNASTDDSLRLLRSSNAAGQRSEVAVRVLENRENVGFARANNQAIGLTGAPFLLLLNPDTEVRPGAIDALLRTLKSDMRIGACAPRLLNSDGTLQPSVYPSPPSALRTLVEGLKLYLALPRRVRGEWLQFQHWDHAQRRQVKSFKGAAIMARRAMIDEVGGLDERFHMYGEDVEWCLRIIRAGWLLVFEPAAEVVHYGGQSAMKRWADLERSLKEEEGHLRFQELCLPPSRVFANTLARTVVLTVARMRRKARRQSVDYLDAAIGIQVAGLKSAANSLLSRITSILPGL